MTAPSIKEALLIRAQAFVDRKYVMRADARQKEMGLAYVEAERQDLAREIARFCTNELEAALATLKPSGERREAIARIIDPAAFGHVTGRETASWRAWNDSRNALALKTADRILASVLVQDGPTTSKKEVVEGERREALQQLIMKSQDCGYGDEDTNGKHRRMFCDDDSLSSYHRSAKCDCRAVFDAILASGLVQDEAGWRPIETAPQDGTEILLFTHHEADEYLDESFDAVQIGWWDDGNHAPGSAFHRDAGWHQQKIGSATHWIPLPAPPIRSARNGGAET